MHSPSDCIILLVGPLFRYIFISRISTNAIGVSIVAGEAGKWDRFTTSRPLQDVRDDDSDEEGIDLEAEKRRLMLTRVNSAPRDKQQLGGANPPSSGPEPSRSGQEAKEAKPQAKDEVPPPKDTVPDLGKK